MIKINLRSVLLAGLALAAAFLAPATPALANVQILCAPEATVGQQARRVVNPNTSVAYVLNGQGCAAFAVTDVGWALTQGFSSGPSGSSLIFATGAISGLNAPDTGLGHGGSTAAGVTATTTNFQIGTLPANSAIRDIIVQNLSPVGLGGAATLNIGTVNCNGLCGGTSAQAGWIVSNLVVTANQLTRATQNAGLGNTGAGTPTPQNILSTTVFSQATPIWVSPTTNWNSASLIITILWDYF